MKTSNKIIIGAFLGICTLFSQNIQAQQVWQFSQYLQNEYLLNPAFAGAKDMLELDLSYRQQWLGIEYSPSTFYVSGNTRIFEKRPKAKQTNLPTSKNVSGNASRKVTHGIGGLVLRDQFGAFSQTLISGSYAVHVPLSKKWTLSAGLEASVKNFVFDNSQIKLENTTDPALAAFYTNTQQYVNSWEPNVDFGLVATNEKLFLAYSTEQFLEGKLKFDNANINPNLQRTHQFYGGYKFKLNRNLQLIPNTFVQMTNGSPMSVDLNVKLDYQDRFYVMAGTRLQDAIIVGSGVFINDQIKIGYSYDKTISALKLVSNGSHEFFVGFELFKK